MRREEQERNNGLLQRSGNFAGRATSKGLDKHQNRKDAKFQSVEEIKSYVLIGADGGERWFSHIGWWGGLLGSEFKQVDFGDRNWSEELRRLFGNPQLCEPKQSGVNFGQK